MTRCKFKVDSKLITENGVRVNMTPVTCGSEENDKFFSFTPSGLFEVFVTNDSADKFNPGQEVYIDITIID